MAEKSPPLSPGEFRQLQWLLGGLLVLVSTGTVVFLDIEAWGTVAAVAFAALLALVNPRLPSRVPRWLHRASFPLIASLFLFDLWWTAEWLAALIRLDLMLMLYRSISYRERREDLQLILLGLFLIVVAGVLTVALAFAVQLLLFTACALALLLVITIADAAEEPLTVDGKPPPARHEMPAWAAQVNWRRLAARVRAAVDWRLTLLAGALFAGVVLVSGLLFISIPRFQIENSLFLERFISRKARTGFSDSVRFGQVSEIIQDNSLALSVDVSDPARLPATPYFRMLILDEYIPEGGFRLSPRLRHELTTTEHSSSVLRGSLRYRLEEPIAWTFYLEAGVSRYLPLPGPFFMLRLREPHPLQFNGRMNVAALKQEPVSMLAYRMEQPLLTSKLADGEFASRFQSSAPRTEENLRRNASRLYLEQPADRISRDVLARTAAAISGGAALSPELFGQRTSEWLARNHGYSLSPRIPGGEGDPLVRWLSSHEAGHCELFAGSLVLLARAAGIPARLIVGFKGGTWNAYSNGLTVRNSDAHAWCELWDGYGAWLRVDPTPGAAQEEKAAEGTDIRERRLDRSWTARLESLRVFWYRRIVNFDQRAQFDTFQGIKEGFLELRRLALDSTDRVLRGLKARLIKPWSLQRAGTVILVYGLGGVLGWLLLKARSRWRWGTVRVGRIDTIRREAGRWLLKLDRRGISRDSEVARSLERLRYASPDTWPVPAEVFRAARKAMATPKAARRF